MGALTLDATTRRQLIDFELGLQAAIGDEVVEGDWGRACLTPSLPMTWDASWIAIKEPGMAAPELAALSDEVMGGAGFSRRNVHVCDEADGRRLPRKPRASRAGKPGGSTTWSGGGTAAAARLSRSTRRSWLRSRPCAWS